MTITELIGTYHRLDERGRKKPESLYGPVKMWAHLRRQGIEVARCTVEPIMKANGWRGVCGPNSPAPPWPTRPTSGPQTW